MDTQIDFLKREREKRISQKILNLELRFQGKNFENKRKEKNKNKKKNININKLFRSQSFGLKFKSSMWP